MNWDSNLLKECIAHSKAIRNTFFGILEAEYDEGEHVTRYEFRDVGSKRYGKQLLEEMDYIILDEGPKWVSVISKYWLGVCLK